MTDMLAKILISLSAKMLTERFLSKMIVYALGQLSKSTENDLDDKITKAVAEALGVEP